MEAAPALIDLATVVAYTLIDARHQMTGNCKHWVAGHPVDSAHALAIGYYSSEPGYYLFYCNSNWEVVTDTWHESIDDAKDQAEFEYKGTANTWINVA